MIVQPRDPDVWRSLPEGHERPSLPDLLAQTTPKIRQALCLTVRTLAYKSAQRLDGAVYYLELCSGYIATMGPSRWAARAAWNLLVHAGWIPVAPAWAARDQGAHVPIAVSRGVGQHVLLPEADRDLMARQTRAWMADGTLAPLPEGDPFASGDPTSDGWVSVVLGRRRGSGVYACRCPFHEDRRASAGIFLNADGRTGGGRCMACVRQDGSGLTFAVRQSDAGGWFARRARPDAGANAARARDVHVRAQRATAPAPAPGEKPAEKTDNVRVEQETIEKDRHIPTRIAPGGGVLGVNLRASAQTGTASSEGWLRGDLFEVLERACHRSLWKGQDKKALEASGLWMMACMHVGGIDRRAYLPDSLYHVSDMEETGSALIDRVFRGKVVSIPTVLGWRPWRQRRVLFDLDGLRWGSDGDVETFAAATVRWIRRRREFSGRVAVVRTSPTGVQIVAELTHAREGVIDWWKKNHVRSWYAKSAQALLKLARKHGAQGGIADLSSGAAGRLGRRPGWRLLKDGSPYRSHLVALEKHVVVRRRRSVAE